MPNFDFKKRPTYPTVIIDTNVPITQDQLISSFSGSDKITLLIRSAAGAAERGGHFFSIVKVDQDNYNLETMEGDFVDSFTIQKLLAFINHSSGLKFDSDILLYCQNSINFHSDDESNQ